MACRCGNVEAHVIMTRVTFDGYTVYLWSDGAMVDRMGNGKRKAPKQLSKRIALMGNVCTMTWQELIA